MVPSLGWSVPLRGIRLFASNGGGFRLVTIYRRNLPAFPGRTVAEACRSGIAQTTGLETSPPFAVRGIPDDDPFKKKTFVGPILSPTIYPYTTLARRRLGGIVPGAVLHHSNGLAGADAFSVTSPLQLSLVTMQPELVTEFLGGLFRRSGRSPGTRTAHVVIFTVAQLRFFANHGPTYLSYLGRHRNLRS